MTQYSMTSAPGAAPRDVKRAVLRGLTCKCPSCGEGALYDSYLQTRPDCASCGQALHHHRADDAPAWLTILVVGHLVGGLIFSVHKMIDVPLWADLTLWPLAGLILCLALLPLFKGAVVGLQWASRMHGFDAETN